MTYILNGIVLFIFDILSFFKGYRFEQVASEEESRAADRLYDADGFDFPDNLLPEVRKYNTGARCFIAYYKGELVGVVRLADPKVVNRAYDHYGVDLECEHNEIQNLVVKKEHRDSTQFVMLGLVKEMYVYSVRNAVKTWSACGKRNVYLTMRRYCKDIQVTDIDCGAIDHPLTQYLDRNNIIETYFTMEVASFAPAGILGKYITRSLKQLDIAGRARTALTFPRLRTHLSGK